MPARTPSPASITYTTNPLLSPTVLGGVVTLLASIASAFGVHVLDDPMLQQQLVLVLGLVGTAVARWMWPNNDGRLSFAAPLSTPASQDLPAGASVVNVPAPADKTQTTDVQPLPIGTHTVEVMKPTPLLSPATPSTATIVASAPPT